MKLDRKTKTSVTSVIFKQFAADFRKKFEDVHIIAHPYSDHCATLSASRNRTKVTFRISKLDSMRMGNKNDLNYEVYIISNEENGIKQRTRMYHRNISEGNDVYRGLPLIFKLSLHDPNSITNLENWMISIIDRRMNHTLKSILGETDDV